MANLMETKKGKVLLGLSGGVDSTAAALALKEQGYEVIGLYFDVIGNQVTEKEKAALAAKQLGITFIYKNVADRFSGIIDYFCESYFNGETPNPCIMCNPTVKFATLIEEAEKIGAKFIATGHYAQVHIDEKSNKYFIKMAKNQRKDQSYMLYRLPQAILTKLLLPLGDVESKEQVRDMLRSHDLSNAEDKDSQEVCFIKEKSYVDFLKNWSNKQYKNSISSGNLEEESGFYSNYAFNPCLAEEIIDILDSQDAENTDLAFKNYNEKKANHGLNNFPGNFVDKTGNVLGTHHGIINYTVGQRKGLGLATGKALFVTDVDHINNMVTLGEEKDLFSKAIYSENNVFSEGLPEGQLTVNAKIRYASKPCQATIQVLEDGKVEAIFKEEQRAATPGQSIVFYKDDLVIGGGVILKTL